MRITFRSRPTDRRGNAEERLAKVQGSHPLYRLMSTTGTQAGQRTTGKSSVQNTQVQLGGEAQWMQELKGAMDDIPDVRMDKNQPRTSGHRER